MPYKTITLTDAEVALLDEEATKQETTGDALLQSQAQRQIAALNIRKISWWFDSLPLADKQRIYDAENA